MSAAVECGCKLVGVERDRLGTATYEYDTSQCLEHGVACSHCPAGCKSCWPPDCECYTHQDWPDRRTGDAS